MIVPEKMRTSKFHKAQTTRSPLNISISQKAESTGNSDKIRTFHSSQCICDLGVRSSSLCDVLSCGICKAVKSSFKVFAFGVPRNSGRYGSPNAARNVNLNQAAGSGKAYIRAVMPPKQTASRHLVHLPLIA